MAAERMIVQFLIFWFLSLSTINAQILDVWALGDGEKVFREDLNHPAKSGNIIWDGDKISLRGLYNEVLAFQVITEIGNQGAKNLYLELGYPVHQEQGIVIAGSSLQYGPAGTIEIYSQHYLEVSQPTQPLWFYGSEKAAPAKMTGWIPDALIPVDVQPSRGGFPMTLPVGESSYNQGFWIDIHLPRDRENFPAGKYTSSVKIFEGSKLIAAIPLEIDLVDHYLSDENVSVVWMYCDIVEKYFTDLTQDEILRMVKFEARRHRIEMTGGFLVNRRPFDENILNDYLPYLNGEGYTPENGYIGPGQGQGEHIFPIGMYGSSVLGTKKKDVQLQSNLWVDWFDEYAPDTQYFLYLIDEPGPRAYDWIKERTNWIKSNPGSGSRLPIFTTSGFVQALEDHIDYWAAYNGVDLEKRGYVEEKGGQYWFYNGNRPRYGAIILEAPATDMRVNSWIMYKYEIPLHFLWHGTHWQHNRQGPKGHLHQNVFKRSITFINDDMEFANGDGVFFYPGVMPYYPEESRGVNRLLPSIRLKNIRRGQQDAIILKLAENKIGRASVMQLIDKVVPRAMSEVNMDEEVPWSQMGDEYERIRIQLLELL